MNLPITTDSETVARRPNGTFGPGNVANPSGRPRGALGGRARALQTLDALMSEAEVQTRLSEAMREMFMADPMKFFRQIIMPLLPTETKHQIDAAGGVVEWVRLCDRFPPKATGAQM